MLMHEVLIDGAERTPHKLALHWVDRDVGLTYEQAVAGMQDMAGALASLGVGPGERVTIFAHNGMDYLLTMFGAWRIRGHCRTRERAVRRRARLLPGRPRARGGGLYP